MVFSVIVPVYNVEKYLRECVDSILCQSHTDFELILVDDGSRDGSGEICDEYAAKDARVKVLHKENGGQSTARNAGVDLAQGDFAVFLDSDDFICDSNFLKDLNNVATEDTDIIAFRYCKYFADGTINNLGIDLSQIEIDDKNQFLRELIKRDAFFCSCWSKSTRMSLLKDNDIRFDETLSCEDMDWYYRVVMKASEFKVIDKPYVYYRQRENSVTSTFKEKSIADYVHTVAVWSKTFGEIEEECLKGIMLSSLAKLYCNLLISYATHASKLKDYKQRIFSFRHLLKYDLNPRTRKISRFANVFGLNATCMVLNLLRRLMALRRSIFY